MNHWPTARITHIGLNVSNLDTAIAFYSNAMGMKVMKSADGRFATMSFGYQHHDIALIPSRTPSGAAPGVGMNHFAIEVRDYTELVQFVGRLMDAGVPIDRAIDHRTGVGVYLQDPDGNNLEIWCENHPSMARAIEFGNEMSEEFEENHIGYPLDIGQLRRDCEALRRAQAAGEPTRIQVEAECLT